jgi:hypothetical protein
MLFCSYPCVPCSITSRSCCITSRQGESQVWGSAACPRTTNVSAYCFEDMRLCGSAACRAPATDRWSWCRALDVPHAFATPSLCTLSIVRYLPRYQVCTACISLSGFFTCHHVAQRAGSPCLARSPTHGATLYPSPTILLIRRAGYFNCKLEAHKSIKLPALSYTALK